MPPERLQKIIAAAGLCSRRDAEELITAGRVRVNGPAVTELGAKADAEKDEILVDGKPLRRGTQHVYLMLNKPRGCVTTVDDPEGRPTVMEFLKHIKERIYPVGRLDFHSEGLLLFTNDGEFANRILSTGFGVNKTYWAKVHGTPSAEALQKLREGIMMDGRMTLPAEIRPLPSQGSGEDWREASSKGRKSKSAAKPRKPRRDEPIRASHDDDQDDGNPWFEVVLQEGRQNQIRRMFELAGHPVRKLRRVRIGRLSLGTLKPGEFRHLLPGEVNQLMAGEREKSLLAPRTRRTAADFRKKFSHTAEDISSDQIGEEIAEQSGASSPPEVSMPAAAEAMPIRDAPPSRRPFERRPERPAQPRFTERAPNRTERSRYQRPQSSGFSERPSSRPDRREQDRPRSGRPPGEFSRNKFPRPPSERTPSQRAPFERRPYAAGDRPERQPFAREGTERGRFGRDRENRPFTPRPPRSGSPERPGAGRPSPRPYGQPPGRRMRPGGPPRRDDRGPMERGRPMRDRGPMDRAGSFAGRPGQEGRSGDRQRPMGGRPPQGRPMQAGPPLGPPMGRPTHPREGERPQRDQRPREGRPFERRPFAPRPPFQDRPRSARPSGPRSFGGPPGAMERPRGEGRPPAKGRPGTGTAPPRGPRAGSQSDSGSRSRPLHARGERRPAPRKPLPDEERS